MRHGIGRRIALGMGMGLAALGGGCGGGGEAVLPPAPIAAPAGDAEERFAKAWEILEVRRRPEEAAGALRLLAEDESVPAPLRGRSHLLRARCERLLGRPEAAATLLRSALDRYGRFPALRAEILAEQGLTSGSRSRYLSGILEVRPGQFLDLDAGGLFDAVSTPSGGRAEFTRKGAEILFLENDGEDPDGMAGAMPWIADAPWRRLTTDRGRAAWVQVLPGREPGIVRFVTRVSGSGPVLPPPRDPFCAGKGDAIEVWWEPDPRYASWRVERRVGPAGTFEEARVLPAPPFADRAVEAGTRYGYRVTGVTKDGDEGIPASVQGTTRSAGFAPGACLLQYGSAERPRPSADLLAEKVLDAGGDVTLTGMFGNHDSAGFQDSLGRAIFTAAGGGADLRTPWTAPDPSDTWSQVARGRWIVFPLLGGGVGRGRVSMTEERPTVRLDYEIWPDGDAFPPGPAIEAKAVDGGAEIRVAGPPAGWKVESVLVRDLRGGGDAGEIPVRDGVAFDPGAKAGTLREYAAPAVDRHGRRSPPGTTVLNLLPREVVRGEFRFHYRQTYSIEQGRLCGPEEADVEFRTCAGGISSIQLAAPGGIANLERVLERRGGPSRDAIYGALASVDPASLRLGPDARGDDRVPESDVFVLRTRRGGWAKITITARGRSGSWTEYPATVEYAWNPHGPVFEPGVAVERTVKGFALASLAPEAAEARAALRHYPAARSAGTEAARALHARLAEGNQSLHIAGTSLEEFVRMMGDLGIPAEISPGVDRSIQVSFRVDRASWTGILDVVAGVSGATWRVTDEGKVLFEPKRPGK